MQLWHLIAGVLIFKFFDASFELATSLGSQAPIVTFVAAIALWLVGSFVIWAIARSFNREPSAVRGD